jgi:Glycosyltransferase sugar-binding region containing DXD motif
LIPIVQYWDAGEPPDYVAKLLATFRDRNPDLRHLIFDEATAEGFIAEHFTEREVAAFRACAIPSMRADYLRYCAVLALGGVYADVGYRCLQPLSSLIDAADSGLLLQQAPRGFLINGFFLFKAPGHPLLRLTLDVATTNIEQRVVDRVQMVTGPWIFSALSLLHRLDSTRASRRDHEADGLAETLCGEARALAPTAAGREAIPLLVAPLLQAVGDLGRVAEAFDGVRIAPLETIADWIAEPESRLPYKRSETYWINWQRQGRSIFR